MHSLTRVVFTFSLILPLAWADNCAKGSETYTNNTYCQPVKGITYTSFGGEGTYEPVTLADGSTGQCEFGSKSYNGHFAPLNEQLSIHLRGPLKLLQLAVYTPSAASSKAKAKREVSSPHRRRHGHQQLHKRNKEIRGIQKLQERQDGGFDGDFGRSSTTASSTASTSSSAESTTALSTASSAGESSASSTSSAAAAASSADENTTVEPAAWTRIAYYDSASGSQSGLTLMGNHGSSGCSGSDGALGSSLSYASSDGSSCASSPQTLESDNYLPTDREIAFFTDQGCSGDSCGYVRSDVPNYKGFDGDEKAFFFEFQMPDDGKTDMTANNAPNMPAIWLLNAQIPRIEQYGTCSCWASGCGEFDLFEVLHPDDNQKGKAKSTIHRAIDDSIGDSDYFDRPFDSSLKLAVIMRVDAEAAHIMVANNDTQFGASMAQSAMDGIYALFADTANLSTMVVPAG